MSGLTAGNSAETETEELMVMALCEAYSVFLRPDTLYRFEVTPGCPDCAWNAAQAEVRSS